MIRGHLCFSIRCPKFFSQLFFHVRVIEFAKRNCLISSSVTLSTYHYFNRLLWCHCSSSRWITSWTQISSGSATSRSLNKEICLFKTEGWNSLRSLTGVGYAGKVSTFGSLDSAPSINDRVPFLTALYWPGSPTMKLIGATVSLMEDSKKMKRTLNSIS